MQLFDSGLNRHTLKVGVFLEWSEVDLPHVEFIQQSICVRVERNGVACAICPDRLHGYTGPRNGMPTGPGGGGVAPFAKGHQTEILFIKPCCLKIFYLTLEILLERMVRCASELA